MLIAASNLRVHSDAARKHQRCTSQRINVRGWAQGEEIQLPINQALSSGSRCRATYAGKPRLGLYQAGAALANYLIGFY